MPKKVLAHLKSINRGFGGDSARYIINTTEEIVVSVNWALCHPFTTEVFKDKKLIATFNDQRYVQPHEALERLGFTVRGSVDFAYNTQKGELTNDTSTLCEEGA